MCGILVWADTLKPLDSKNFEYYRDLLRHRGPDDAGLYLSSQCNVGLAFRRLSIIDLTSAGSQPMTNDDQSLWIVFNGEVYNFSEIRLELESRGHSFKSQTDTEVVLHSYAEWGDKCVEKFIGMFSFAIWDIKKRKIFAARDRLGIKPLYYSVSSHSIMLASELKPILLHKDFNRDINMSALWEYFARGYITSPRTIFTSANSLTPGHFLEWSYDSGEIKIHQYWNPLNYFVHGLSIRKYSEDDWIMQLEELLRSSVKYRLISDVPLGVFLSGGIDSSLIASLMCQVSTSNVKSFTIGFKEAKFDEGKYAQEVARHLGTSHTHIEATYKDALDVISLLPEYFDEPFADSSQIPTYLVSKLARQYVTVALSGDGGDELFCGYETYRLMESWQHLWKLPQVLRNILSKLATILPNEKMRLAGQGLALPNPVDFGSYFTSIWRPQEVDFLISSSNGRIPLWDSMYLPDKTTNAELLEKLMLVDLQRYLPNDILTKVDRASMAVSLEARVPLLDHRVVEFALKMPLSLKMHQKQTKYVLRRILYQYVPRELIERPKQGFVLPLDSWLKTDLYGLVEKYLNPVSLRKQGLFNRDMVQYQVKRFMSGQAGHARVWSLLMFQMWYEKYLGFGT